MRNLKRALSLTLASVMLLGMMIVGTSAAPYTDQDQITNVTEATVLKDLEIMVGDGKTFGAETTVTRGQMAIMICKIMYGNRLNVNAMANETKFSDVPAGSYFAGYVNFAAEQGIISGYGNGKFGPGDPVSTAQAALMLCRALGYFQGGELDGQGWGNNALTATTMATKLKIFGDLRLETNAELSRDNVAAMVFNTMTKAVPVMYNDTWKVYYTDSQNVLGGTQFSYLDTWAFQNYDLVYAEGNDNFGRPTTKWGIGSVGSNSSAVDAKGDLVDTYVTLKTPIIEVDNEATYTFTNKVTAKKLADAIGRNTADGYDWYINGGAKNAGKPADWTEDDTAIGVSGNGVLTQVFVKTTGSGNTVTTEARLYTIPYYVAKVDGNYNSSKGELRITGLDDDGAAALPGGTKTTLSSDDLDNLETFADEDYVLVTVHNKEVQSIEKATVVTGNVDSFVTAKNVTVDGKKYEYTKGYRGTGYDDGYKLDTDYNVVLDPAGYVIFADGVAANDDYLYVLSSGKLGGAGGNIEIEAVFTDGVKNNVTIHKDSKDNLDAMSLGGGYDWGEGDIPGRWYKYEMKGGKYVLGNPVAGNVTLTGGTTNASNFDVTENGKTSVKWNGGSVAANSGTTFIVKRDDSITVYTGVKNVPDLTTKNTNATTVAVIKDGSYADYVFIEADKADLSSSGTAAGEHIFIVDATRVAQRKHSNGDDTVYVYEAVVNGEEKSITATGNSYSVGLYNEIAYDGEYVDDMTAVATDDDFGSYTSLTGANFSYEKGTLSWTVTGGTAGSIGLADGCKVFTSDGDKLETSSGSGLANDYKSTVASFDGAIYLVIENNMATEVYVHVADEHKVGDGTPAVAAVYESTAAVTGAAVSTTPAPSTIAGVAVDLSSATDANKMDTIKTALDGASTITTNYTVSIDSTSKVITLTAITGGVISTDPADFTEATEGKDAVAAVYKSGEITALSADGDITAGGHTYTHTYANTDTLESQLAAFVADYASNATDKDTWTATVSDDKKSITFTAKHAGEVKAGATGGVPTAAPADTTEVTAGDDAVAAVYTLAPADVDLGGSTKMNIHGKNYTVTGAALADKLAAWVAAYNADAGNTVWKAAVKSGELKVVFTAKTAGAAANNSAPEGTTQVTAGADAVVG